MGSNGGPTANLREDLASALKKRIGAQNFETWLSGMRLVGCYDRLLKFEAPLTCVAHIEEHILDTIKACAFELTGRSYTVLVSGYSQASENEAKLASQQTISPEPTPEPDPELDDLRAQLAIIDANDPRRISIDANNKRTKLQLAIRAVLKKRNQPRPQHEKSAFTPDPFGPPSRKDRRQAERACKPDSS